MARIRVLLPDEQDRRLKALAKALGRSKARLAREGVELVLLRRRRGLSDPLLELIGLAGKVRRSDLSTAHDKYLATSGLGRRR